jgi:hypothetical protein
MLPGLVLRIKCLRGNVLTCSAQAAIETGGKIGKKQAYALASSNIEKLLGAKPSRDLVVTHGGDLLDFNTKIVGVISPERGVVDLI